MKSNIGKEGRIFRLIAAILLLVYAYMYSSWLALAVSLFIFYEVYAGWCLFYQLMGKSSCDIKKDK
jgi:hypothetical protein